MGLCADGSVVASGDNGHHQCNVYHWQGIVAIAVGAHHTVGLCADGSVVATGWNDSGQCNVSDWKLFNSLDTLEQERKEAAERAEQKWQQKIANLTAERASLQNELANFKGLFSGVRRRKIEARLAEIDAELKR